MFSFGFQVRLMRFFGRVKTAFADALAVRHDLHSPLSLVRRHAQKARLVALRWAAHVLQVDKTINVAQICKTIVLLVAVYVINVFRRPFACHMQPRQTVRQSFLIVDYDGPVAGACGAPRTLTDQIRSAAMRFPHKHACVGVVVKNCAYVVCCNHDTQFTMKGAA